MTYTREGTKRVLVFLPSPVAACILGTTISPVPHDLLTLLPDAEGVAIPQFRQLDDE